MRIQANRISFISACELSAITHGHPTGFLSAGFFASVIADLAAGLDLMDSILKAREILLSYKDHEETLKAVDHALDLYHRCSRENLVPGPAMVESLGEGWVAEDLHVQVKGDCYISDKEWWAKYPGY